LISTKGFAFRGAIVEPPRLRLRGLHKPLSPAGVFAFRSNQQLVKVRYNMNFNKDILKQI
jgi:hypothetical protein